MHAVSAICLWATVLVYNCRLLRHRDLASPPHPGATGVASQLRGVGGAQSSAMAEEVRGVKRQSGVEDEGGASGSGRACQSQPADKREEFGHYLGPPAGVREVLNLPMG